MAEQMGILPLKGAIGKVSFFKSKDGFRAGQKTTLDGSRIATEARFDRTRENMSEFGRAAKYGKLIRQAFETVLLNAKDARSAARLGGKMRAVIKADILNDRGSRTIMDGDATLLEEFEFNANASLSACLKMQYEATIDRAAGTLEVILPAFVPKNQLGVPPGTTHFKINSAGAAIDFVGGEIETQTNSTGILPCDNVATLPITLTNQLAAASPFPLFLVLGIEFYQQVNSKMYPLKGGSFNALKLVKIVGY